MAKATSQYYLCSQNADPCTIKNSSVEESPPLLDDALVATPKPLPFAIHLPQNSNPVFAPDNSMELSATAKQAVKKVFLACL